MSPGCVSGANIDPVVKGVTLDECKDLCDRTVECLAIEYFSDHGGTKGGLEDGVCLMQSSRDYIGCNGKDWNKDAHVKVCGGKSKQKYTIFKVHHMQ